jgi:hypothetical protein
MPFTVIPTRTTADPNSAADVNTLMENSTFTKSSRNHVDGLVMYNDADYEHDIGITPGICKDSTFAYTLELSSTLIKRIDAAWSAGDHGGFLDTGSVAINTQYAVWLIRKDSDGTSDAVASTSFTSPSPMPTGYTYKRLIRGFATDGSANIINNQWLITDVVNDRTACMTVVDQKAANTPGGTFTLGAWRTRDLNTILINEIPGASLASNQITLPAGSYRITAFSPSSYVGTSKYILYNVTGAADLLIGTCTYSDPAGAYDLRDSIFGTITLSGATIIELRHRSTGTYATYGFGHAANIDSKVEVYSQIEIIKIG